MEIKTRFYSKTSPERPAYINAETGESLTFRQLEETANQGARLFRCLGLKSNDHLAVMIENSLEYFTIVWAALRAGLYFTPISTAYQKEEIEYIVKDCNASIFIASRALSQKVDFNSLELPAHVMRFMVGGTVEGYKSWETGIGEMPTLPIDDEAAGRLMLYTSGTTGRPKGVINNNYKRYFHDNQPGSADINQSYKESMGICQGSILLSNGPLYHSGPLNFSLLFTGFGVTVVFAKKFEAESTLKAIEKYKVTHSFWVPTMFYRLLKLDQSIRNKYDLSSHQIAIHSASQCPVPLKEAMLEWWGPIIVEFYGGTESNGSTFITAEEWLKHKGSVGKAVLEKIHIVDETTGEEVPIGETGVIYFEGGMEFEYWRDQEHTSRTKGPGGWTTIGDIGYIDQDGYLYIRGRKNDTIISGGVNIYPLETENVLRTHPKVRDVVIIGVPNEEFGEEVKAIIVPVDMSEATPEMAIEIIEYCRSKISHIKCPRSVDFVADLPRSELGKLRKSAIRTLFVLN